MFWTAEKLWDGETAVIAATGPSMAKEQLDYCRGKAKVMVINTTFQLAPWADALYFADHRWFDHHAEAVIAFPGLKVTIENAKPVLERDPTIKVLKNDNHREPKNQDGLCLRPDGIKTGRNSGYQAMNVAVHLGVKRIVLLGFDMRADVVGPRWWFKEYGWASGSPNIYQNTFLPRFRTLKEPMEKLDIEVINATPNSALDVWPMETLEEALDDTVRNRPRLHSGRGTVARTDTDTAGQAPGARP